MIKELWVAKDGSVFTDKAYKVMTEYKTNYHSRKAIAFNVGDEIAKYIVELHNKQLKEAK